MPVEWLVELLGSLADTFDTPLYVVRGVIVVVLVCIICGMVGSLVVGNRMAFFSDAMAHCAFAGVALGYLSLFLGGAGGDRAAEAWAVPLIMVLFGTFVGAGMVFVKEQTALANDIVIGVFFALAIGFGAMLYKLVQQFSTANPESFLFGSLLFVHETDLLYLAGLVVVIATLFCFRYNQLVFASFNPSLARTRRVPLRLNNYLFIILLALVVNLSIKAVGALLINALLVVPAAAAANISRNLRQMFWLTIGICLASGLLGFALSSAISVPVGAGRTVKFAPSGTIVVVSVAGFFVSVVWTVIRRRTGTPSAPQAS